MNKPTSSQRISRSATFDIAGNINEVFPLFGPVREKEWAEGWQPQVLYPSSAIAELHMIFKTASDNPLEESFTWIISRYIPEEYLIEYTVFTHLRVWFITVRCEALQETTRATVTYAYVSTSDEGHALNCSALERMFFHDLRDWQQAINTYLTKMQLIPNPN